MKTLVTACIVTSILAACSSSKSVSVKSADVKSAGVLAPTMPVSSNHTVLANTLATVSSRANAGQGGGAISYAWEQTSGPAVTLNTRKADAISFTALDVIADQTLTFKVTAANSEGSTSSVVSVVVIDDALPAYVSAFDPDTLLSVPSLKNCSLSNGNASVCMSLTLKSSPQAESYTVGPWCPRNINDDANAGGMWIDKGADFDVDGNFILSLGGFYNDSTWQMYDKVTGEIPYTRTRTQCSEATNPNVGPEYQNVCVECQVSFLDAELTNTLIIPIRPVLTSRATPISRRGGVGFSGVRFDGPAPVRAILSAYTLAPFDDCGGHINLRAGYHIHAITDAGCLATLPNAKGHAPQIGVAMDGFAVHERLNGEDAPTGLDTCRGHDSDQAYGIDGYHYHVDTPGSNAILPCHSGAPANSRPH